MASSNNALAEIVLIITAALWGFHFIYLKDPSDVFDPFSLTASRHIVAFALLYFIYKDRDKLKSHDITNGLILGFVATFIYLLNTFGLSLSTPGRAGFISSIAVVLVPFAAYFFGQKITGKEKTAVMMAFAGLFLFTWIPDVEFNTGEIALFIENIPYAVYLVLTAIYLKKSNPWALLLVEMGTVAVLSLLFGAALGELEFDPAIIPVAIIAGIFVTLLPSMGQIWGQQYISPVMTEVILSLTPVFGAIFSNIFNNETFGLVQMAGATLIIASVLYPLTAKDA